MDKFDDDMHALLQEYFLVENSIKDNRALKAQADKDIGEATKYIGEIKGQMLELMEGEGVVTTDAGDFSVTRKRSSPKVVIVDDARLSKQYVRLKIEPNKEAIKKALSQGDEVPGATLDNGGVTIQIRRKNNA